MFVERWMQTGDCDVSIANRESRDFRSAKTACKSSSSGAAEAAGAAGASEGGVAAGAASEGTAGCGAASEKVSTWRSCGKTGGVHTRVCGVNCDGIM